MIMLLISLPLLVFNVVVDPYGVFLNGNKFCQTEPNKRYQKVAYLLEHPGKYDSFIFGSSRANFLSPQKIHEASYFNMTYSNGLPSQHYRDIKILMKNGVKIKNLLIGIDYFSLLDNFEPMENDLLRMAYPITITEKYKFYKAYLLNRPDWNFLKLGLSRNGMDRSGMFVDGTISMAVFDVKIDSAPEAHAKKCYNLTPFSVPAYSGAEINKALDEINNIVKYAKANKIKTTFYINPTYYTSYLNVNLDNYFYALKKLADITDYYDFSGLNSVVVNSFFHYETSHFRHKTGDMMIGRIFDRAESEVPADFGKHVTRANVDAHILYHKSAIADFFASRDLSQEYDSPLNLSGFRKRPEVLKCSVDRINEVGISVIENPWVIQTPWVKMEGRIFGQGIKGKADSVFIKIGNRIFKAASCFTEQDQKRWKVMIPNLMLKTKEQRITILMVDARNKEFSISHELLKLQVVPFEPRTPLKNLKNLGISNECYVDFINGIKAADFNCVFDQTSFLNITGWARDSLNNCASGGVIFELNGKMYKNLFLRNRKDVAKSFNNKALENAGWGIIIPIDDLKEGNYKLTFKILNAELTGYYSSGIKIPFEYVRTTDANVLNGLKKNDKTTNFSVDIICGEILSKASSPINVSSQTISINGWAVDLPAMKPASDVIIDIDGKLFKAFYGTKRPDVAQALGNTNYLISGWTLEIPASLFTKGEHKLKINIISGDGSTCFQPSNEYFFKTI